MPNVPISSETGSEWRAIFGHLQLIECMGICVLSLAHKSELRVSDVYLHILGGKYQDFFLYNQPGTCPWMALAWIVAFDIFLNFLEGVYWEYTTFRGSNISCSVASIVICCPNEPLLMSTKRSQFYLHSTAASNFNCSKTGIPVSRK